MCFGSDQDEQAARQREVRTTEDVGRLFERYRAEARHFAESEGATRVSWIAPERRREEVTAGHR